MKICQTRRRDCTRIYFVVFALLLILWTSRERKIVRRSKPVRSWSGYAVNQLMQVDVLSLLVRFVDDSIYISTSKEYAVKYAEKMCLGFPEYGCRINTTKTVVNFPLVLEGQAVKQVECKRKF